MRGASLLVLCVLCAVACGPRPAPKPVRAATCDVSATWVGSATDPAGTGWELAMVLHQDDTVVGGTVEWQGGDGRRVVEDVRGLVACADGLVTLHSVPPATSYRLELAADDATVDGRFENDAGRPGTITARRR
jgi:hypothetical protein